jgi:hypothetical protein
VNKYANHIPERPTIRTPLLSGRGLVIGPFDLWRGSTMRNLTNSSSCTKICGLQDLEGQKPLDFCQFI